MPWELASQTLIVERNVHVSERCALHLETSDPVESLIDGEMARVPTILKSADHEMTDAADLGGALLWKAAHV